MRVFLKQNQITHWLDSSAVYGSNPKRMRELRSFSNGRLRNQFTNDGEELPPDDLTENCRNGSVCLLAG